MRLEQNQRNLSPPDLLPIDFLHFLVLASDAALLDLVDVFPWNFYLNSFSVPKSSSLREAVI